MKDPDTDVLSLSSRIKSFHYAFEGIWFCLKSQHNAWLHAVATAAVCLIGVLLDVSAEDWRWLAICIVLVWFSELMNTAFEFLCDLISPEFHLSVKRAKDIAAGAVLVCAAGAVVIGILTLWPYVSSAIH